MDILLHFRILHQQHDFRNAQWDVSCYNPQIEVTKTAVVSDVNANGLNDVGDKIIYTINVFNTGLVTVTLVDQDTLTNQVSTFLETLTLEFTSVSSQSNLSFQRNYFKYSSYIDDEYQDWNEIASGISNS